MKTRALFALLLFFMAACAERPSLPERLTLRPGAFKDLPGWENGRQAGAVPALLRSCSVILKKAPGASLGAKGVAGTAGQWWQACETLRASTPKTDGETRRFFETWFTPYVVNGGASGLFTGYYEAELSGAWQKNGRYQTPLWQRPDDLITANLGDFKPELSGQKIVGKVEGKKFVPYDERADIASGSLAARARPLAWVSDPTGAFFLEIQGSGLVRMPDGQVLRVGYDAQNGKDYVPIGRVLYEEGEIDKPVTMQKIRAWLRAHPERAQAMMNRNPSAVFFRKVEGEGPIGAEGVALTPKRSLAVDPAFVPLGVPLWLVLEKETGGDTPPPVLLVAQDTGGAIKGAVRGDLFWGAGGEAEARAGAMQDRGTYYLLLPKTVAPYAGK